MTNAYRPLSHTNDGAVIGKHTKHWKCPLPPAPECTGCGTRTGSASVPGKKCRTRHDRIQFQHDMPRRWVDTNEVYATARQKAQDQLIKVKIAAGDMDLASQEEHNIASIKLFAVGDRIAMKGDSEDDLVYGKITGIEADGSRLFELEEDRVPERLTLTLNMTGNNHSMPYDKILAEIIPIGSKQCNKDDELAKVVRSRIRCRSCLDTGRHGRFPCTCDEGRRIAKDPREGQPATKYMMTGIKGPLYAHEDDADHKARIEFRHQVDTRRNLFERVEAAGCIIKEGDPVWGDDYKMGNMARQSPALYEAVPPPRRTNMQVMPAMIENHHLFRNAQSHPTTTYLRRTL